MKGWIGCLLVLVMVVPGCMVSKNKYEAAIADMESAKTDLEKNRMHRQALEKELKNLKNANEKIVTDLEMMTAEVQRIKEGRENEQALLKARKQELGQERHRVIAKVKHLKREYEKVRVQNQALKKTVGRYQKELKGVREKKERASVSSSEALKQPRSVKSDSAQFHVADVKHPIPPKPPTFPVPQKAVSRLVNINQASARDMVLFLGLSKQTAESIVANRPYRLRGELVAKNIVKKPKFDKIKDRITAAP